MKQTTWKLLFINPDNVLIDTLNFELPIHIVAQPGLEQAYIVDTGIPVKKDARTKHNNTKS